MHIIYIYIIQYNIYNKLLYIYIYISYISFLLYADAYFWVGAQGSTVENGQLPYVDVVNGFYRVQRLPSPNGDR